MIESMVEFAYLDRDRQGRAIEAILSFLKPTCKESFFGLHSLGRLSLVRVIPLLVSDAKVK